MGTKADYFNNIKYPRKHFSTNKQIVTNIDKLLEKIRSKINKGLHIGAGSSKLPGLINCDLYNPDADLKADASNLDMFDDASIDLIESHHMIEHLSFKDTEQTLKEWHRVLGDNGLLVLTFPDMTVIALKWIKHAVIYPIIFKQEKLDYISQMLVGSQENEGMFHRNVFNFRRISRILMKHGFKVEYTYCRYPNRPTPSRLVIARKSKLNL